MRRRWIVALVVCLVLLPVLAVRACGPDFAPDVFVRELRPDEPKQFAAGRLGVLLPTYPRMDLMVAFRYLNGGVLDAQEQAAYTPTYSMLEEDYSQASPTESEQKMPDGAAMWAEAHAKYAGHSEDVSAERSIEIKGQGFTYQSSYLNCNDDAFRNAAATLQARAQSWGEHSALLTDWVRGQDAVFANCSGTSPAMPAVAAGDAPALLKADRAYQTAAALFYQGRFDEARDAFAAISKDAASPWQGIAGYVEARCLIRQAFLGNLAAGQNSLANFDATKMKAAADLLHSMLKERHAGISQAAIESTLNMVRIRIDPMSRVRELAAAVAGPAADASYKQNLFDLTWFLDQKLDANGLRQALSFDAEPQNSNYGAAYKQATELRTDAPVIDWALTFQSPSQQARLHALAEWKKSPTLYWLVAALTKATGKDEAAPALIAAAAKLDRSSPAWETATYHRARLLLEGGKAEEARMLLDQMLPQLRAKQQDSAVNQYQSLRMAAAKNLAGFLENAPQKMLMRTSESYYAQQQCLEVMKDPKRKYDCVTDIDTNQLNDVAAGFFNTQASLRVLADAAESKTLPQQLRQAVAMMAWTRAVLLKDEATADRLLPLLPAQLQQEAGKGLGFSALMTLVRNPGLRPYLETGVQRSYSYDFVESYRDNWWCKGLAPIWATRLQPFESEPVGFLNDAQRQKAAKQLDALKAQEGAKLYLGSLVLDYVRAHGDDPLAAESLYLVLRMIRYGCDIQIYSQDGKPSAEQVKIDALKQDVARLMRQRYASSPWTKKAAPLVG